MVWLLGALLAIVLPGLAFAWWLTGDDYRGVHRSVYTGAHRVPPEDLEGPTVVVDGSRYFRPH